MKEIDGKQRVVIEQVSPVVENGLFPAKRIECDYLVIQADVFTDGHDEVRAQVQIKAAKDKKWKQVMMHNIQNDRWEAEVHLPNSGDYQFRIVGWVDHLQSWYKDVHRKMLAAQEVRVEFKTGAALLRLLIDSVKPKDRKVLDDWIKQLENDSDYENACEFISSKVFREFIQHHPLKEHEVYSDVFPVVVEKLKSEFSTWYEFFPRSASSRPGKHGTFKDCDRVVEKIAQMGFDVIYFPPIHPIGYSFRKGKNNSTTAREGEPGSPWAIGNEYGGHKAVHPELGTIEDFEKLVATAREYDVDIAMDFALQCSQDHPYIKQHPQWFKWRSDGSIQYAENPPKKYQDVVPFNFECEDWKNLWKEIKSILDFWISKGVRIFRVDNPHTKPFELWRWLISEIKKKNPEVIFLSEAFTRPKIMNRLAKIGFTQSYTYFTWRTTKNEIQDYVNELVNGPSRNYFRPNFWPNTPDILPFDLQNTRHAHHAIRFVLASTLSASYGMYGPVYDLAKSKPYPGKEEYLDSEKYEIRQWDWDTETPLRALIKKVNYIRHSHKALQTTYNTEFLETDNPYLIAYLKTTHLQDSILLVVVNLDPNYTQSGFVRFPYQRLKLAEGQVVKIHDLLSDSLYQWDKGWNYVMLNPADSPAHIFKISW
jgi:starch synthase (maltosyl-transferring)